MINKGAESLPGKDAQTYKQLAVPPPHSEILRCQELQEGAQERGKTAGDASRPPRDHLAEGAIPAGAGGGGKGAGERQAGAAEEQDEELVLLAHVRHYLQAAQGFSGGSQVLPERAKAGARQPAGHARDSRTPSAGARPRQSHRHPLRHTQAKAQYDPELGWIHSRPPPRNSLSTQRGDFPSLFKALSSLDNLIKTTELKPTELAHYYLYRVVAFRDAERWDGMYEELKRNKTQIKDEVLYYEFLHQCCLRLDKGAEAEQAL
jgi:hypothetical protein